MNGSHQRHSSHMKSGEGEQVDREKRLTAAAASLPDSMRVKQTNLCIKVLSYLKQKFVK